MQNLTHIWPSFIVAEVKISVAFYVDKLGFAVTYIAPQNDPFFAIVGRDNISVMLKAIAPDIQPMPNHTRHEWARLDAYIHANDPDALFEEYSAKGILFHNPLRVDSDNLRGFEVKDADGYVLFFGKPVEGQVP